MTLTRSNSEQNASFDQHLIRKYTSVKVMQIHVILSIFNWCRQFYYITVFVSILNTTVFTHVMIFIVIKEKTTGHTFGPSCCLFCFKLY